MTCGRKGTKNTLAEDDRNRHILSVSEMTVAKLIEIG